MKDLVADLNQRLEARREAAGLSVPLTYTEVLRYFFWKGIPGLVGAAVILLGQVAINGMEAAVLFGGGTGLFVVAILAATAQVKEKPEHVMLLVLTAVGTLYGMSQWVSDGGDLGVVGWLVLFFGFVSLIIAGVAYSAIKSELSHPEQRT